MLDIETGVEGGHSGLENAHFKKMNKRTRVAALKLNAIPNLTLREALPHGSGIDEDWWFRRWPTRIECHNSFHMMNDDGFYVGWQPFKVVLFVHTSDKTHHIGVADENGNRNDGVQFTHHIGDIDFRIESIGGWKYRARSINLKDDLEQVIGDSLREKRVISANKTPCFYKSHVGAEVVWNIAVREVKDAIKRGSFDAHREACTNVMFIRKMEGDMPLWLVYLVSGVIRAIDNKEV